MKLLRLLLAFSLVHFSLSTFSQSLSGLMLDSSFSYDGKVVTKEAAGDSSHASIKGLVLQSDGKIIAAGTSQKDDYSTSKIVLTRYLPDGKLDNSFGNKGVFYSNYKDYGISNLIDIKQQSSGKMVAIGYAYSSQDGVIPLLFRFNKDGSIDNSFGNSGWTILPEDGNSIAIQSNDGIIITSARASKGRDTLILRRFKKNGTIDSAFGKNSIAMAIAKGIQGGGVLPVVAIDKLSRIVAGFTGVSNKSSANDIVVVRFTENGLTDSSFNRVGIVTIDNNNNTSEYLNAIAIQPDNKILVGGESYLHEDFLIARLNVNGVVDSSFGDDGKVTANFKTNENWGSYDYVTGLLIQNNKIVATGTSDQILYGKVFAIARFFSDGRPDKSFGFNGQTLTRFFLGDAVSNVSIMQPDGKIICGGSAQKGTNSGQEDFAISRYLKEKIVLPIATEENNIIKSPPLLLYPNPCHDKIFISGLEASTVTVFIKDRLGNILQQSVLSKADNYQITVSSLRKGFYFLEAIDKNINFLLKFYKE